MNAASTHAPDRTVVSRRALRWFESVRVLAFRAPAFWLTALVASSAVARAGMGAWVPSPWILPDESVYAELARSIAAGDRPSVRGVPAFGWGEVYPTVIAPAWLLFDDLFSAYRAALVINSIVMSLAAVPAYLLARLFVGGRSAMAVAVMTVLVPSMAYTGVVMTENACYPAFVTALYLIGRSLLRPSIPNQALALGGLGVLAFTRIQGVALVAAYFAAIVTYALLGSRVGRQQYLRQFVFVSAVTVLLALVPVVVSLLRGDGALAWLGARSATFDELHVAEIPRWTLYLAADLVLYLALIPAAASLVVIARGLSRGARQPARMFAAIALPTLVVMVGSVAVVSAGLDVDGVENLNERYVFYVAPLLLVGFAVWIEEDVARSARWVWVVVAACVAAATVLPVGRLAYNAEFQSVALLPWIDLSLSRGSMAVALGAFSGTCAALWLLCWRTRTVVLWLVVGLWMSVAGIVAVSKAAGPARYFAESYAGLQPAWIDEALPEGATAPVVWDQRQASATPDQLYFRIAVTEFFNRTVTQMYSVGGATYYERFLPSRSAAIGPEGTIRDATGRSVVSDFVLTTCRSPVDGTVVAEAHGGELQLVEVRGPIRIAGPRSCGRMP